MGIDNQFLIGTLLFAGLGYYLVSQKTPVDAKKEKEKHGSIMLKMYMILLLPLTLITELERGLQTA